MQRFKPNFTIPTNQLIVILSIIVLGMGFYAEVSSANDTLQFTFSQTLSWSKEIHAIDFSPNDKFVAFGDFPGDVRIYRTRDWQEIPQSPLTEAGDLVDAVEFSPDGEKIAYGSQDRDVYIHRTSDWSEISASPLQKSSEAIRKLDFSPDGSLLAYGTDEPGAGTKGGTVYIHSTGNWSLSDKLSQATDHLSGVSFSPDGDRIAYASEDGNVYIHSVSLGTPLLDTLMKGTGQVRSIDFSPTSSRIAYGSDGQFNVYNTTGLWTEIPTSPFTNPPTSNVEALDFSPVKNYIAYSSAGDKKVYLRETENWNLIPASPLTKAVGTIGDVEYSSDGKYIAYADPMGKNAYIHGILFGAGVSLNNSLDSDTTSLTVSPDQVDADTTNSFTSVLFDTTVASTDPFDEAEASTPDSATHDAEVEFPLLNEGHDTVSVKLWTNQSPFSMMYGLRSDTTSVDTDDLPLDVPHTDTGLKAFGRTAFLLEFADSANTMLGTDTTTTDVSDSFAYVLEYNLSQETTRLFNELGYDTSAGSDDFGFSFADTYAASWQGDPSSVTVDTNARGGITIRVSALGKDLPGAISGPSLSSSSGGGSGGTCLIERTELPLTILDQLRWVRDWMMESVLGRVLADEYYAISRTI